MYNMEIVAKKSGKVEFKIQCNSRREAEKVQRGVDINLNAREYKTRVVTTVDWV